MKIFKAFPWGQDIVKMIEDPDGKPRTTTYKYWDDPDGPHYTFLKTTIHPNGKVESILAIPIRSRSRARKEIG